MRALARLGFPVFLVLPALIAPPALSAQERVRLGAQVDGTVAWHAPTAELVSVPAPIDGTGAQLGERALLGTAGSALGIFVGAAAAVQLTDCIELGCVGIAVLGAAAGSIGGTLAAVEGYGWVTGADVPTGATLAGAALGGVAGALVGGGLLSLTQSDGVAFIGFALTQGTLAAMASVQD